MNKATLNVAASLGHAVSVSRRARKMRQADLASLAGIGINTMVAIEKGAATVAIGHYLEVLDTLGLTAIFNPVVNMTGDTIGIAAMAESLPKRIDGKRKPRTHSTQSSYND